MDTIGYLASGIATAFSGWNFAYVVIGAFVGTWIGMLPGLGPATGIALLLPLTYGLDPTGGMIMLCGIYFGSMYGGSISSILLNTPGDVSSVITMLDGNPMARKGRGGAALFCSAVASFIGGTVGLIGLTFLAEPIARFALRFGPAEYFALMTFALVATATLLQGAAVKGLIAIVLGLMVATVGIDLQSGAARFTMGSPDLFDGVSLIAVIIGLFGISEVFTNIQEIMARRWGKVATVGRLWMEASEWARCRFSFLRGSVIGFLVGVVPGAGGAVATLLSYAAERRASRHPEEFGKGAIEGVAGPEAANNASVGGALIPLFTLGLPGSSATAILLGALMIFGIQPGPRLFTESPDLVWGIIGSLYVANVVLVILNVPFIGIFVRMLTMPGAPLNAIILLLAITGAYSLNSNVFDVQVALLFGVAGFLLRKAGVPLAPFVLSVALGGTLEQSLRQALSLSDGDPAGLVPGGIAALFLGLSGILVLVTTLAPAFRATARRRTDTAKTRPQPR
ncbi:tripartite tricarboxylate transporter permease [Cereibacter sphaeroides]|uniref:tripartite tricarboxylate transporter permease n=1 Tax=Cereibacter sphaeroides TaxID=1063 RepID=UPI000191CDD8|nr:tripartite tricarboxylate transporter permease [Cereibacter sphaeroides]ACM04097.1 Tricarboxylate transport protein TctA [Cereibacter sphaeroides KD131]EKX57950.1 Tricarboxylate transport membrane protein TctA [Rhodobacter sp. AKP1]RIA00558.1 tripartite tricarboxylate transporter permease [Cereibacter sphaeroides]